MPGGIIDLKFTGPANLYLNGNPQITFFKTVYKKYSNFSMEYIELPFNTSNDFNPTGEIKTYCKIDRHADLVHDMYLIYDLPAIYNYLSLPENIAINNDISQNMYIPFQWVESVGNRLIEEVSINLNAQSLDKQKGKFMEIYNHLTMPKHKKELYNKMISGDFISSHYGKTDYIINDNNNVPGIPSTRLFIPLNFWFCKNPGLSLPLVSLQYTMARLDFIFSRYNNLFKIGNPLISPDKLFDGSPLSSENQQISKFLTEYINNLNLNNSTNAYNTNNIIKVLTANPNPYYSVLANYIYLDDDERQFFAQTSHEYLINQTHYHSHTGLRRGNNVINININHPVIELIWFLQRDDDNNNDWLNFTDIANTSLLNKMNSIRKTITNMTDISNNLLNLDTLNDLNALDSSLNNIVQNNFNNISGRSNRLNIDKDKWDNYSIMKSFKLIFNGNDRFETRLNKFFELVQIYKYHSGNSKKGLYTYSFSLNPEDTKQPSGTCNMSRINKQQIELYIYDSLNPELFLERFNLNLYSVNYNIFRIIGGIGQIVFSN